MESKISIRQMILGINICIYETLKSYVEHLLHIIKYFFSRNVMYIQYKFFYLILLHINCTEYKELEHQNSQWESATPSISLFLSNLLLIKCCWTSEIDNIFLLQPAQCTETVFREKHGAWDPMPELTITSPDVDSSTCTDGQLDNPMPQSALTLCQSRLYPPVRD